MSSNDANTIIDINLGVNVLSGLNSTGAVVFVSRLCRIVKNSVRLITINYIFSFFYEILLLVFHFYMLTYLKQYLYLTVYQ